MKRKTHLYLYLVLNVIVSAATTLAVLVLWNNAHRVSLPPLPTAIPAQADKVLGATALAATAPAKPQATYPPTDTPVPPGQPVIEILSVVGPGDLEQEVVLLKRLGEGNLRMAGWKLQGENNNTYVFPQSPELVLYKDGAVQVYTKPGADTATDVYWNRSEPAWRSGETIHLLDAQGAERASYLVP